MSFYDYFGFSITCPSELKRVVRPTGSFLKNNEELRITGCFKHNRDNYYLEWCIRTKNDRN